MNTNQKDQDVSLLLKDEIFNIVGAAMEVLNQLGHGLNEKPYENSLVVEFRLRSIPFEQQRRFEILYKNHMVGIYVPDLIAYGSVVVDAKVLNQITDIGRGQMINYLKITKLRVGVILNFEHPRLEWERIVV